MNDYKLKLVLAILTGLVFSFIFILLAFVLPSKDKKVYKEAKGMLEKVSQAARENRL